MNSPPYTDEEYTEESPPEEVDSVSERLSSIASNPPDLAQFADVAVVVNESQKVRAVSDRLSRPDGIFKTFVSVLLVGFCGQ